MSSRQAAHGRPRPARRDDLDAIAALEAAAFAPADCFPRRAWRRLLTRSTARIIVVPSTSRPGAIDGGIAWLLRRGARSARMYSLAVHPEARGRGLGRLLIAASLPLLPARIDVLSLEVRRDNQPAVGLYCALGFVETALLRHYYGRGRHGLRLRADRSSALAAACQG